MNTLQQNRLTKISIIVVLLAIGVSILAYALRQNIHLYYTPSMLVSKPPHANSQIRLGGMVKKGTVVRDAQRQVRFVITDFKKEVTVHYQGILPDLFREGQGIVTQGIWRGDNGLQAQQVLAKHDENYAPPLMKAPVNRSRRT